MWYTVYILTQIFQDGWTPLIASSAAGRNDTVELLIEKRALLNVQTKVRTTVFIHAMPMNTVRDSEFTSIHVTHPGGMDCIISGKLEGTYQDSRDLSSSWC